MSQGTLVISRCWKSKGPGLSLGSSKRSHSTDTPILAQLGLILALLTSRTARKYICIVLSHPVCGNGYSSHGKLEHQEASEELVLSAETWPFQSSLGQQLSHSSGLLNTLRLFKTQIAGHPQPPEVLIPQAWGRPDNVPF